MSFHGVLHPRIKLARIFHEIFGLGVAILALQLPIDNSYIHTYFSRHIIFDKRGCNYE
jgi:hypothetical protein